VETFERTVEMRVLSATLDGSFEGAIRTAGGPSMLAYHMADVLRWDLDFTRDLKRGDRFKVLYEQVRMNGQDYAVGNVVALVYDGALGRHQEAYGYGGTGVYYDEEGRPSMKMFLRSPLRYSRITSSFSLHRFHPVFERVPAALRGGLRGAGGHAGSRSPPTAWWSPPAGTAAAATWSKVRHATAT